MYGAALFLDLSDVRRLALAVLGAGLEKVPDLILKIKNNEPSKP